MRAPTHFVENTSVPKKLIWPCRQTQDACPFKELYRWLYVYLYMLRTGVWAQHTAKATQPIDVNSAKEHHEPHHRNFWLLSHIIGTTVAGTSLCESGFSDQRCRRGPVARRNPEIEVRFGGSKNEVVFGCVRS